MRAPAGGAPLVALFGLFVAYVVAFPNHLGESDEAVILYEAVRLSRGAVMYRDVFEIITPGSQYLFAGLFALFGATLSTARVAMAVAQAAIAVLVIVGCRRCGARWWLAIAAAAAHLALGLPAWPYASPHWLSTLLMMLAFVLMLGRPWTTATRGVVAVGVVLGLLAMVQQQKAALLLPAAALALIADRLLDRHYPRPAPPAASLLALLLALAGGAALVVVPAMTAVVLAAGVGPVFEALIRHPLLNYGRLHGPAMRWGGVSLLSVPLSRYTVPALLRWQPLVLLGVALRGAWLWRQRAGEAEVRRLATLLLFALGAMASVSYFPDFIHLAFIAPLFAVGLAALLELGLQRVPARLPALGGALLLLALGAQAGRNLDRAWTTHPVAAQTPFGRVDLRNRGPLDLAAQANALLPPGAPREVFCYPECGMLHLVGGFDNPTPYQKLLAGYSEPTALQTAIAALEARRTRLAFGFFGRDDDPVVQYVRGRYERVGDSLFYLRRANE